MYPSGTMAAMKAVGVIRGFGAEVEVCPAEIGRC
jgi:hypothetical protein